MHFLKQPEHPARGAPAYHVLRSRSEAIPFDGTHQADYVVAADGIFMRIPYMGMLMHFPVVPCSIRGLAPSVYWCEGEAGARVPEEKPRREQPFAPLYHVLDGTEMPPLDPGRLYEYLIAGNGVFLRARKRFGEVVMPISAPCELVGLQRVEPGLWMPYPRVEAGVVEHMLGRARDQTREGGGFDEILFYLLRREDRWEVIEPEQDQSPSRCAARDKHLAARLGVFTEVHSHHTMDAYFSDTDDGDEKWSGIYCVLGRITTRPELRVRVAIDSYVWATCPASAVFDMPPQVHDALGMPAQKRRFGRR
jgi:PRTRC genetic system protein A